MVSKYDQVEKFSSLCSPACLQECIWRKGISHLPTPQNAIHIPVEDIHLTVIHQVIDQRPPSPPHSRDKNVLGQGQPHVEYLHLFHLSRQNFRPLVVWILKCQWGRECRQMHVQRLSAMAPRWFAFHEPHNTYQRTLGKAHHNHLHIHHEKDTQENKDP